MHFYFRDHLSKIYSPQLLHTVVLSRALSLSNNHEWKSSAFLFSTSIKWMRQEQHSRDLYFSSEQHKFNSRRNESVHEETASLRPERQSRVRCDRREECKGIDDRETNERAGRIRTWRGATRLVAREELASRAPTQTHPTAPFQPTRPTEPPLQEQVPTLSLSLFHPRRRSHHPPTLDRPFGACIAIYPRIYPRSGSTLSGSRPTCSAPVERFIYMRLSPGFVLASNFITRTTSRYEE